MAQHGGNNFGVINAPIPLLLPANPLKVFCMGQFHPTLVVHFIVVQEKGDPVGGVVQEQQSLEEAGQEWSRLFHKHSQKHPGGRLEESM